MSKRFVPGQVDYEGVMAREFNTGRAVSPHAQEVWHSALEPYLAGVSKVLDVGSGTGRFSILLARWFGVAVVGIEPAGAMRQIARVEGRHPNASYLGACAEYLPLKAETFQVALLSNVYHHLRNRRSCAEELSRVLCPGGRILLRGAFGGRLENITLFDHFPEAKLVCEEFPTLSETIENFTAAGFTFDSVRAVVQQTCSNLKELASRTRLRADTTLILLPDDVFWRRQAALEDAAAREMEPAAVVDTLDLVVFRRR